MPRWSPCRPMSAWQSDVDGARGDHPRAFRRRPSGVQQRRRGQPRAADRRASAGGLRLGHRRQSVRRDPRDPGVPPALAGQRSRPHREHCVDLGPLLPPADGSVQRLQGRGRRAQRDAAIRARRRAERCRRVGALSELGAHEHHDVGPQPPGALQPTRSTASRWPTPPSTRRGGASSWPRSPSIRPTSPPRCATPCAPIGSTSSPIPRASTGFAERAARIVNGENPWTAMNRWGVAIVRQRPAWPGNATMTRRRRVLAGRQRDGRRRDPGLGGRAEEAGFDHIMVYDHVLGASVERLGPGPFGAFPTAPYTNEHTFHEILTLFSHLAAVTTRIAFVTSVLILPQRQTALAAKQIATIDLLSGGRLRVAVGAGWNAAEYGGLGADFDSRRARLEEQVDRTSPAVDRAARDVSRSLPRSRPGRHQSAARAADPDLPRHGRRRSGTSPGRPRRRRVDAAAHSRARPPQCPPRRDSPARAVRRSRP